MDIAEHQVTVVWDNEWIKRLLYWSRKTYTYIGYYNPNRVNYPRGGFKHLLLAGDQAIDLESISTNCDQYLAGIVSYDQKNRYEHLASENRSLASCPDAVFFRATFRVEFESGKAHVFHPNAAKIVEEIASYPAPSQNTRTSNVKIKPITSKESYFQNFARIQEHIREGDIYEMNYCIGYEGCFEVIDPIEIYLKLNELSPMPFSGVFVTGGYAVICASPERFLKKEGNTLLAQPIKGSIRRGKTEEEDEELVSKLRSSEKEQAENLMIVDLMRNDLARVGKIGSINVDELFGVYRFRRISQMISSVSCKLPNDVGFARILSKTFPMGSMTGAPKIKAMELIDRYEDFKRGWFSGSMGYIATNGDFDWNVIIRSIVIDLHHGTFYFGVGSAITIDADANSEYEECLLKSQAIFEVFDNL
jgi:para-aminobenzoate synthetase component 1